MFIGKSEVRERSKFVDRVKGNVINALSMKEVTDSLGRIATSLLIVAESLYLPNIRHGIAYEPKRKPKGYATPLVPIKNGEVIQTDASFLTTNERQKASLKKAFAGWAGHNSNLPPVESFLDFIDSRIVRNSRPLSLREGALGAVFCGGAYVALNSERFPNLGKSDARAFNGQPIITLPMGEDISRNRLSAVTAHEMHHVVQHNTTPISPAEPDKYETYRFRNELEAYFVGFSFGDALFESDDTQFQGDPDLLLGLRVELLRRKHANPSDPFFPTKALREAVRAEGMDTIYMPNIKAD